jgi:hypothetical protein
MGQTMAWTSKITKYELNKVFDEVITSGSSQINEHITFASVTGGTRFTLVYDLRAGGFLKLVSPLVTLNMRGQAKANLTTLKAILEKQT